MTELRGFRHVALTVTDCDASAEWYQSVLGFEELFREANDERRACVMRFPRGAFGVGVVEHVASADAPFDPSHRWKAYRRSGQLRFVRAGPSCCAGRSRPAPYAARCGGPTA